MRLLFAARLAPEAALAAGSWRAREDLGLPALGEGAPADVVVVPDDPRSDLETLLRPRLVMLNGRVMTPQG